MTSLRQQIEHLELEHNLPPELLMQRIVDEALIRRVAKLNLPLMMKGSYVTVQYLPEHLKKYRIIGDIDWFGLGELNEEKLNQWLTAATTCEIDDGITFRSFSKNAFWRRIDYAMADDFPTVNTDLIARFTEDEDREENYSFEIYSMDISFNIKLFADPVPITYHPIIGSPFIVPRSCPLDIQIAWKLHQCIVGPRFKDIIDLIWLLSNKPEVNWDIVFESIEDECKRDNPKQSNINYLQYLLNNQLQKHPLFNKKPNALKILWEYWLTGDYDHILKHYKELPAQKTAGVKRYSFTKDAPIPNELSTLLEQLHETLNIKEVTDKLTQAAPAKNKLFSFFFK